ncbi:hypothetical protein A8L48_03885 [Rhizobium rhizogenes]|nr:hypothetical protein B0909_21445 [Rhizobium rhizogenes]OAM62023.1 hypothetical protein A8L48_03885 [Rhizobium rhizogenes]
MLCAKLLMKLIFSKIQLITSLFRPICFIRKVFLENRLRARRCKKDGERISAIKNPAGLPGFAERPLVQNLSFVMLGQVLTETDTC